jgi:hypothetical protein
VNKPRFLALRPPDSVSNLIRRAEKAIAKSAALRKDVDQIEGAILKQKTGSDPMPLDKINSISACQ